MRVLGHIRVPTLKTIQKLTNVMRQKCVAVNGSHPLRGRTKPKLVRAAFSLRIGEMR